MKYFIYLYWRLLNADKEGSEMFRKINVHIALIGYSLALLLCIFALSDSFFGTRLMSFIGWLTDGTFIDKLIRAPTIILPIFLFITVFTKCKKATIENGMQQLDKMSPPERKRRNKNLIIAIVISIFFFVFSMTSSVWVKMLKANG